MGKFSNSRCFVRIEGNPEVVRPFSCVKPVSSVAFTFTFDSTHRSKSTLPTLPSVSLCMLLRTTRLVRIPNRHSYAFQFPFMFSSLSLQSSSNQTTEGTAFHISNLINKPNWEHDKTLKSLASHMTPYLAGKIIGLHSNNVELGVRFFKWVCRQSSYCYDLDGRIQLLGVLVSRDLFGVAQKAVVLLIQECEDSENGVVKLMGALDGMTELGFRLSYPCYSTLLMCLAKLNMGFVAFLVYRRMVNEGFVLGGIDYRTVVNALCKNGFVQAAEMFCCKVLRLGFGLDTHVCTSLVLANCRRDDLGEAFRVFEKMSKEESCRPNSVTYSILIHGLCEAGRLEEAFQLKQEMVEKGCQPSTRTYTVLIKAKCDIGMTDKAMKMLDEMATKACVPNVHTYTILIDRLCREGKIEEANGVFRKMLKHGLCPGIITFNALINGYCKEGWVVSAFQLLSVMEKGNCKPNIRTYNELMEGLCRVSKSYKAFLLLRRVVDNGLLPDRVTYNILVDGFCKEGQLNMAFNIFNSMNSAGLEPDGFTFTALIDGLCKLGRLEQANGILGSMVKKGISLDEVTFTALIDGHCKIGKAKDVYFLFENMVENRCLTTAHTFNCFLDALGKDYKLNEANAMLGKMMKYGLVPSVVTHTILIEGHCRAGFVLSNTAIGAGALSSTGDLDARSLSSEENDNNCLSNHVFRLMDVDHALKIRDEIKKCGVPTEDLYNFLVVGLCKEGRIIEADQLTQDMVKRGLFPDKAISSIIEHYCKTCKYDNCLEFMKLVLDNKFVPSFASYCWVIHGLRNVGRVQEAQRLVSDLVRHTGIEEGVEVTPYIEFLMKEEEDDPDKCLKLIKAIEQVHYKERPII
ncbi:pentatricopeptide repeat-containing protein At3g07290, mitochondrial [Vitis riparia]|uniref:pentatricopeptide repeat-containing protein At3g07290, mitochondrial n=1 Tax=Vitis riparia TaxID=96939 RepID=UPI00155B3178|nr:pentatricopeptide repeat-containing protein At3g07290, mitochondrial [Vitis riparia]